MSGIASWTPDRRNHWLLVGVAVCFAVYVLVAVGLRYPYTTDEAIYFSQLNPEVPNYGWAAWRAWGMAILAGPVALIDAPLTGARLYLVILSSVGLFLAFRPWLAVSRQPLAPIAAALFGGTSVAAYNGSLALPNFYSALAAIAATGYFMACRRGADNYRRSLIGLAAAVAIAALVRPSDSLWLVMPLFLAWLGLVAWRRRAVFGALVLGQVVGWAPWIIESIFRFGGPFNRLDLSSASLGGTHLYPDLGMVRLYVRLWNTGNPRPLSLNVPVEFRGGAQTLATVQLAPGGTLAVIWWIALVCAIVAGVLGAIAARRSNAGGIPVVLMPLVVGLSVAFPYLFMMRYGQLRFLLPAIGLLAVPVAAGVIQVGMVRRPSLRVLAPGLAAVLVLALVGVQMVATRPYRTSVATADAAFSALIRLLGQADVSGPCAMAGDGSFNVAYQVGCDHIGRINRPGAEEPAPVAAARGRGETVVIALRDAPPAGTFMDRWRLVTADIPGQRGSWFVYLPPV
ncbi:hypothetical protein GCM10022225_41840 [Plantactinospora mayteni]|uniref:Glycosyltransferase RgtA/B/C/D-like domain-containing protein n=2 Tax=Plantactinospora mayteni TaxID=566021 RepID=A0ABQ4EU70_9ACTN|nr:hypothetical protein Pma05_47810 [Plantactinospora mayteni]